jgi:hypothetical protein
VYLQRIRLTDSLLLLQCTRAAGGVATDRICNLALIRCYMIFPSMNLMKRLAYDWASTELICFESLFILCRTRQLKNLLVHDERLKLSLDRT